MPSSILPFEFTGSARQPGGSTTLLAVGGMMAISARTSDKGGLARVLEECSQPSLED